MERNTALAADSLIIQLDANTELHVVRPEDAEELFTVIERNLEHLHRWLPWAVPSYSIDAARKFAAASLAKYRNREGLTMAIRHRGALCGAIGLHNIDHPNKSTSIGYWLDTGHEGKGIITAACRAIVTEGFRTFRLHRIEIRCATWNHRSSAIPRRLEFVEEGILREAEWLHDHWVDLRMFSMLAHDWKTGL